MTVAGKHHGMIVNPFIPVKLLNTSRNAGVFSQPERTWNVSGWGIQSGDILLAAISGRYSFTLSSGIQMADNQGGSWVNWNRPAPYSYGYCYHQGFDIQWRRVSGTVTSLRESYGDSQQQGWHIFHLRNGVGVDINASCATDYNRPSVAAEAMRPTSFSIMVDRIGSTDTSGTPPAGYIGMASHQACGWDVCNHAIHSAYKDGRPDANENPGNFTNIGEPNAREAAALIEIIGSAVY